MTPELTILTLAALLQGVHFALYAWAAQSQVGAAAAMGPRDEPLKVHGAAGRLQRAMNNNFEALILFSIAVFVITFSDQADANTAMLGLIFLLARVAYLPAYLLGWSPWRTLIWSVGFGATLSMLALALI
jgi:uncharacterized MAPEG superfamily protein